MIKHCCANMRQFASTPGFQPAMRTEMGQAGIPAQFQEKLIDYRPEFPIYTIRNVAIFHCPWCAARLPIPRQPALPPPQRPLALPHKKV